MEWTGQSFEDTECPLWVVSGPQLINTSGRSAATGTLMSRHRRMNAGERDSDRTLSRIAPRLSISCSNGLQFLTFLVEIK